ncbi:MAG: hypothetical protein IT373_17390, partial [Polyangiaceae bacterium]|nr:hypothetical protein [Polyangiaceae bacterium]
MSAFRSETTLRPWQPCRAPTLRAFGALVLGLALGPGLLLALGLLASEAEAAEPTPAAEPAPEGRYPSLRLGLSGSLGALGAPDGPLVPMPDGREIALYAGGPGGDLRVGVGLTDWLALDLQLFGETLLL